MADAPEPTEVNEDAIQRKLLVRLTILQTIPAIVGIVIACFALYAALNEADSVRKQQEAAVWPHLQVDRSNMSTDTDVGLTVTVRNRGIGPARVRSARMFLDGEEVLSWSALFSKLHPETEGFFPRTDSYVGQSVLSPQQDVVVIDLQTSIYRDFDLSEMDHVTSEEELKQLIVSLRGAFNEDSLEFRLCYCSFFNDCWQVNNVQRDPESVEACAVSAVENEF
ncbi:MAG: hypothetical protein AAF216_10990 [Pseudomonadota bacterium]